MKKFLALSFVCIILQSCIKKPEANFTWSPQNPKIGQEVQFTNLSTDAKKYSWNLGDMNISSETNPKHTYKNSGDYIIDLTAHNGLRSNTKTITINVAP